MNERMVDNLLKSEAYSTKVYDATVEFRNTMNDTLFDLETLQIKSPSPENEKAIVMAKKRLCEAETQMHKAYQALLLTRKKIDEAKISYNLV